MKRSRAYKILIVFVLLSGVWIFLAPLLACWLIVEKPLENADVILVLGGSAVYEERTEKAAELYRKSIAPRIVLTDDGERTGWSRAEKRNIPYVEMAQRNLVALGVPPENIEIVTPAGSGTIYEAQTVKEKSAQENWRRILIITSAYHTRRAAHTFGSVFGGENIEIGIAAAPTGRQTPPPFYWWLTAGGWKFVAGEYAKSFYYRLYY
jgi:uncharacterized SAM-binding protein YcdF (DUF218 family)